MLSSIAQLRSRVGSRLLSNMSRPTVQHQPSQNRFVMEFSDGEMAHLKYNNEGDVFNLTETVVPEGKRHHGMAESLAETAMSHIKSSDAKAVLTCDYLRNKFLPEHPEWKAILKSEGPSAGQYSTLASSGTGYSEGIKSQGFNMKGANAAKEQGASGGQQTWGSSQEGTSMNNMNKSGMDKDAQSGFMKGTQGTPGKTNYNASAGQPNQQSTQGYNQESTQGSSTQYGQSHSYSGNNASSGMGQSQQMSGKTGSTSSAGYGGQAQQTTGKTGSNAKAGYGQAQQVTGNSQKKPGSQSSGYHTSSWFGLEPRKQQSSEGSGFFSWPWGSKSDTNTIQATDSASKASKQYGSDSKASRMAGEAGGSSKSSSQSGSQSQAPKTGEQQYGSQSQTSKTGGQQYGYEKSTSNEQGLETGRTAAAFGSGGNLGTQHAKTGASGSQGSTKGSSAWAYAQNNASDKSSAEFGKTSQAGTKTSTSQAASQGEDFMGGSTKHSSKTEESLGHESKYSPVGKQANDMYQASDSLGGANNMTKNKNPTTTWNNPAEPAESSNFARRDATSRSSEYAAGSTTAYDSAHANYGKEGRSTQFSAESAGKASAGKNTDQGITDSAVRARREKDTSSTSFKDNKPMTEGYVKDMKNKDNLGAERTPDVSGIPKDQYRTDSSASKPNKPSRPSL